MPARPVAVGTVTTIAPARGLDRPNTPPASSRAITAATNHNCPLPGQQPTDRRPHHQQLLKLAGMADLQPKPAHQGPPPVDPYQCVLREFLPLRPVPGQQEPKPAERPVLACEELRELRVLPAHDASRARHGDPKTHRPPEAFQ
jgi:hypothetical protein